MKQKILFADDDPQIREVVRILLESEGYQVIEASNGQEAINLTDDSIDMIILDVMMPGINGITACNEIRKQSTAPVLFLTAKSQETDKTLGFSAGGDDYLVKPFSANELLVRVKAALRRYLIYGSKNKPEADGVLHINDISVDSNRCRVTKNGKDIALTDIEYQILLLLSTNRKKVFSVQNIYENVWNEPYFYSANNTVMVHIRNIRKKLDDTTQGGELIRTVWGRGYVIE